MRARSCSEDEEAEGEDEDEGEAEGEAVDEGADVEVVLVLDELVPVRPSVATAHSRSSQATDWKAAPRKPTPPADATARASRPPLEPAIGACSTGTVAPVNINSRRCMFKV